MYICVMDEIKQIELTDEQNDALFVKICDDIIERLQQAKSRPAHLDDIGNEIGIAVGQNTCIDGKDRNIWAFEQYSFIGGFEHGYSLKNGTH